MAAHIHSINTFTISGTIGDIKPGTARTGARMTRITLYAKKTMNAHKTAEGLRNNMGFKAVGFGLVAEYLERLKKGDAVIITGRLDSYMHQIGDSDIRFWDTNLVVDSALRGFKWNTTDEDVQEFENAPALPEGTPDASHEPAVEAEYI